MCPSQCVSPSVSVPVCQSQCVSPSVSVLVCPSQCVSPSVSVLVCQSQCVSPSVSVLVCQSQCVSPSVSVLVCQSQCVSPSVSVLVCQSQCVSPSVDHIYSNCPSNLSDIQTLRHTISDHCLFTANYNSKENLYKPKNLKDRKSKLLSKRNLQYQFNQNTIIGTALNHDDPNTKADLIHIELNSIIEYIAPQSYVQYKTDHAPYLNDEVKQEIKNNNDLLSKAIDTGDPEDWRYFRNNRNITQKKNKKK